MPRFNLRTLLIVLALGPPLLAAMWLHWDVRLLILASVSTFGLGVLAALLSDTITAR